MAQTISQIADAVARQMGEEYADIDVQELFDNWTIEALHEILSEADWGFAKGDSSITSVADQEAYSLDLATGDVTAIWRATDMVRELKLTSKEALVDAGKDMTVTGEPEYYYLQGMSSDQKVLGLYPIPSAAAVYTVRYVLDPSQLTRTSTFPLPEDFIPAVKNFVRRVAKEDAGDFNGSDRAGQAFNTSMRRVKDKYQNAANSKLIFRASDLPTREVVNHLRFPDTIVTS